MTKPLTIVFLTIALVFGLTTAQAESRQPSISSCIHGGSCP